ncbi:hypothetical protein [Pseudomonas aeruginosa]|uniref:hypothetical protein n=1 Tax=Pseudomonas aeruginosa TaxID=287 RepID=UPI0035258DD7
MSTSKLINLFDILDVASEPASALQTQTCKPPGTDISAQAFHQSRPIERKALSGKSLHELAEVGHGYK